MKGESYEQRPLRVVRGRRECSAKIAQKNKVWRNISTFYFLYIVDCQRDSLSIQRFFRRVKNPEQFCRRDHYVFHQHLFVDFQFVELHPQS